MLNLIEISTIKSILRENRIRPNKQFGQHFLVDGKVFEKIIETVNRGIKAIYGFAV